MKKIFFLQRLQTKDDLINEIIFRSVLPNFPIDKTAKEPLEALIKISKEYNDQNKVNYYTSLLKKANE